MKLGPRIALIGNGGGGKSTLARALATRLDLPLTEVDELQFGPSWERVDARVVAALIDEVLDRPRWIVDGFGPWETIERRCALCEDLVFVDLPLAVHLWRAGGRQVRLLRGEPAVGGRPAPPSPWLLRALLFVHRELRPRLLRLAREVPGRVHHLRSRRDLDEFAARHADC